jgi:hypothetical protein
MKATTELDRQKTAVLKAYRTAIRLKHALAADEEIAVTLPEVEERMNRALAMGETLELSPGQVFNEV